MSRPRLALLIAGLSAVGLVGYPGALRAFVPGAVEKRAASGQAETASTGAAPAQDPNLEEKIDTIFSSGHDGRVTAAITGPTSPGCTVGVSQDGRVLIEKAYGMANLEYEIPNRADTIFEAGSTSKQFTAAAVLLLERDGKLSLDDAVRKYLPELPDYGHPLTIRQMLTHTSGLRDWEIVVLLQGWPRTTRVYTQEHVLAVVRRQRALNFVPGTRFSYSNTNYDLAAVLVARVSGQSFAAFTRARIFEPLGMTRTSWRDDARRIVKGRAVAYQAQDPLRVRLHMPIDGTVGKDGLLTTVGDLLKWNENFVTPRVGGAAFVTEQLARGRLSDGRAHEYTAGALVYATYKGLQEVQHSGNTAGYTTHLARFPELRLSVAVLCNGGNSDPVHYTHAIADLFRPANLKPPSPLVATYQLSAAETDAITGLYRSRETGESMTIAREGETLRLQGAGPTELVDGGWGSGVMVPLSASRFLTPRHPWWPSNGYYTWDVDSRGTARKTDPFGTVDRYERVAPFTPTSAQLAPLVGRYESAETDARLDVALVDGSLVMTREPGGLVAGPASATLKPIYADAFAAPYMGMVRFHRDAAGSVTELSFVGQSVWDLRYRRQRGGAPWSFFSPRWHLASAPPSTELPMSPGAPSVTFQTHLSKVQRLGGW